MASIQRLVSPLTGGVIYRAQIRAKGRPSESANFPNRKEANDWARATEAAIREGRYFPQARARRTAFDELAADYLAHAVGHLTEKERTSRTRHLAWWAARFEGLSLAEITREAVSRARDVLAAEPYTRGKVHTNRKTGEKLLPNMRPRSGATVNRYLAALSDLFTFAVKERNVIERNPVSDLTRRKEARGRTRFLTDDERETLLAACATSPWPALRALVLLAVITGARKGELITLRWPDVDLKTGRALVRHTKNGEQRVLPLAGRALEVLRGLRLQNSARSEYVFPQPFGDEPGAYEYFDAHWYVAREAAGLADFRFHDLRHTTASMLAAQGASLLEIADVLGHKTLAMVKRYSHLLIDHKAGVIAKMVTARSL